MKKPKNIVLLIGIICVVAGATLQVIQAILRYFSISSQEGLFHFLVLSTSPVAITLLLLVAPAILLARNVKHKTGKVLPMLSVILSCVSLFGVLLNISPKVPQYLIYNDLGMANLLYFTVIADFLKNGGLLHVIGCVALIVGGWLSFPKKKNKGQDE